LKPTRSPIEELRIDWQRGVSRVPCSASSERHIDEMKKKENRRTKRKKKKEDEDENEEKKKED
jgi:hypothetical protein